MLSTRRTRDLSVFVLLLVALFGRAAHFVAVPHVWDADGSVKHAHASFSDDRGDEDEDCGTSVLAGHDEHAEACPLVALRREQAATTFARIPRLAKTSSHDRPRSPVLPGPKASTRHLLAPKNSPPA